MISYYGHEGECGIIMMSRMKALRYPPLVLTMCSWVTNHEILIPGFLLTFECFLFQLALLGHTAHIQILLIPVCHVQLTPMSVGLLLQLAPALQDISELHRRVQVLAALVRLLGCYITSLVWIYVHCI